MALVFSGGPTINVGSWSAPDPVTVTFWMILNSVSGSFDRIWGLSDSFEMRVGSSGALYNDIWTSGGTPATTSTLSTGTWYLVCGQADTTAGVDRIIVNDTVWQTATTNTSPPQSGTLTIGNRTGTGDPFDGTLADFRVYDRYLSLGEVQTIYACRGADNIVENLLNRWMMRREPPGTSPGAGSVIEDEGPMQQDMSAGAGTVLYAADLLKRRGAA